MCSEQEFNDFVKRNNGIFKYTDLFELGYNQRQIKKLEQSGVIERVEKGIYSHKNYFLDPLKIYQMQNSKLIYSHETAAYLHDLTERFPRNLSVTTESGYHLRKKDKLNIHYIKKELFLLGVEEVKDMSGNMVRTYDKERTLCDIIRNKDRIELQVYTEVIQNYFNGKVKLNNLSRYARAMGMSKKVAEIVVLMMKP